MRSQTQLAHWTPAGWPPWPHACAGPPKSKRRIAIQPEPGKGPDAALRLQRRRGGLLGVHPRSRPRRDPLRRVLEDVRHDRDPHQRPVRPALAEDGRLGKGLVQDAVELPRRDQIPPEGLLDHDPGTGVEPRRGETFQHRREQAGGWPGSGRDARPRRGAWRGPRRSGHGDSRRSPWPAGRSTARARRHPAQAPPIPPPWWRSHAGPRRPSRRSHPHHRHLEASKARW